MASYDKYYTENENYFGEISSILAEFFKSYPHRGSLIDLGAGQGRNSIPLTHLGYDVTAVDISQVGLDQITNVCPQIKSICYDIYTFDISTYDFILMDSMLHFYKNDLKKEKELVNNILNQMKPNSVFVNSMVHSHHAQLLNLVKASSSFEILSNKDFIYAQSTKYNMLAIKKS